MYSLKQWLFYLVILVFSAIGLNYTAKASQLNELTTIKYVVKIQCTSGSGSGVIVNGKILTANHVVKDQFQCYAIDYKNNSHELTLVKSDEERDLAILSTDSKLLVKGIRLAKMIKQKAYDEIYTIGFPLGLYNYWMNRGQYQLDKENFSMSNMSVIFGNSGGGVFTIENKEIRLVGIVSSLTIYKGLVIKDMSCYASLNSIRDFLR